MSQELQEIISEYCDSFPRNIVLICNKLGITVQETKSFPNDISGVIFKENDKYIILINESHSIGRKSFTIAHELGHYFLHRDLLEQDNELVSYIKSNNKDCPALARGNAAYNQREREANEFAAKLLMPEKEFIEKCQEANSIEEVAQYFGVSVQAASVRANILGGWFFL